MNVIAKVMRMSYKNESWKIVQSTCDSMRHFGPKDVVSADMASILVTFGGGAKWIWEVVPEASSRHRLSPVERLLSLY